MSARRRPERHQIRTKLIGPNLALIRGPDGSGPNARCEDQVIAITPHWRVLQALGEGIAASLTEGAQAQLVDAVNGAETRPPMSGRALSDKRQQLEQLQAEISEVRAATEESGSETVRAILVEQLDKLGRQERQMAETIAVATRQGRNPRPRQPVEVRELLAVLSELARGSTATQPLGDLIHDFRPTVVSDLTIGFQAYLALPAPDSEMVMVGPICFTTENTTRRISQQEREQAMAKLCLEQAWPVSVVAAGVPLITTQRSRQNLAKALSKELRQLVGSKGAAVLGGCEAPEVMAVISRHFGLGSPELKVGPELEKRILDTYVSGHPPGAKSWIQARSDSHVATLVRRIHNEGASEVRTVPSEAPYWERQGSLKRIGRKYVRQTCQCGSKSLALIPTPEIEGLVCLQCRADRSGLRIPASWNVAVADREYWEQLGYDLAVPSVPGLPTYHLNIRPLTSGGSGSDTGRSPRS